MADPTLAQLIDILKLEHLILIILENYQKQFEICLDFLHNHKNKQLEFNIISNLMISPEKLKTHIMRIKELVATKKNDENNVMNFFIIKMPNKVL